ncbi:aerobactin synthase [Nitrosomonas aestuarii]|uniref:Aerobactin synthase n=1 Tax=Nitrosomonas aestuarii TaxID=52441 RepID=A0A1I3ZGH5_9PROT|nr:IucA/IucC family protein [Nitrosomonas aestuarii]SFK42686.1 aerobactin synthase [Nitrosomonas aestuarii]
MSWETANRNLIVKAISELYFEEIFTDELSETEKNTYTLKINEQVNYAFKAFKSVWCDLVIDADTLTRSDGQILDAARFFKETQYLTKMGDITLANFLEEMFYTLYSDQVLLQKPISVEKMYQLDSLEIETYLNGHPKLILNKGRIGWSPGDLSAFAPENSNTVKFVRLAIKKNLLTINCAKEHSFEAIATADLSKHEMNHLKQICNDNTIDFDSYYIIPVHTWQWENKIRFFFQKDISSKNIVFLSSTGDDYKPHISIRTFSNYSDRQRYDLKLPISILNTSCVRGIPSHYISVAADISEGVESILKQDDVLVEANTDCLKDLAAFSYVSPEYSDIQDAPYRYKEFLGAIWREPSTTKLKQHEKCLMTGSLAFQDNNGNSLIGHLIDKSSLSIEQWLEQYFKKVVIPLYHLQSQYGIGLVAHGQNTLLKLKNSIPSGLIIKDFQGDLRFNKNLPSRTRNKFSVLTLKKIDFLPAEHIIYDLITGHFVSVLRFVSQALFISHRFKETNFYHLLGSVISDYENNYPTQSNIPSLMTSNFHRILLNKARFTIGYHDSAQRPRPELGNPLMNPLLAKGHFHG